MNVTARKRLLGCALAGLVAALPATARACTVCMGDPNSHIAGAANGAIFVMLGLLGCMLAGMGAFAFYIYKHAHTPIPPHIQLVESLNGDSTA